MFMMEDYSNRTRGLGVYDMIMATMERCCAGTEKSMDRSTVCMTNARKRHIKSVANFQRR
jgi:hypothetical protein